MPDGAPAHVGRTIEHYEIEAPLGQGGMGLVYRARDTRLGRAVALKLLPPEWTSDPDRKRRMLQEARTAAAVNHPALTQIYDVGETEDGVFIAMELVEGRTVESLIKAQELDLLGTLEVAIQVASGLHRAHEAGIIHRDVKPANVMVTPDGHGKLLDFGLAKFVDPPAGSSSSDGVAELSTLARTKVGMVLGTLRYMSPEQARGLPLDHRSDIFSFGVMLYEMAAGAPPFKGETALDTLHAIAFEEPPDLHERRTNVPPALERVVSRCLRKAAADRYADCGELLTDLKLARREAESGVASQPLFLLKLKEGLRRLAAPSAQDRLFVALAVLLIFAAVYVIASGNGRSLIGPAILGLFLWRRFRNRTRRLARRFARKARKLPEVRLVALEGTKLTVATVSAVARTHVRLRALVDDINSSMFFGEPFSLVIREDLEPEAFRALLSSPVLYVRE
jgi:hypothetical protein